jgi:chromosome segregation ATPase
MTDEQRKRFGELTEGFTFETLALMVVRLESEKNELKKSADSKAEMNNKLLEENKDLKWQVENMEDEKKPIEEENQQYRERNSQLQSTIDSLKGDADICRFEISETRRINKELFDKLVRHRRALKNIRRYIKEMLEE